MPCSDEKLISGVSRGAAVNANAHPSGTSLPEDDDENIIRDAFMKSYEEAQPCQVRIPGMQDFAAAVSIVILLPFMNWAYITDSGKNRITDITSN